MFNLRFATNIDFNYPFNSSNNLEEFASIVLNINDDELNLMLENANVLSALEKTFLNLWNSEINENRHQILIIILNQRIEQSTKICEELELNYLSNGIKIIILAIGDAYAQYLSPDTQFNCLEEDLNIQILGSLTAISNDFYSQIIEFEICDPTTKLTEFDGSYR